MKKNKATAPHGVRGTELISLNGFCMAMADSVPGVSGGTVAFIMGFYERLLSALQNIASKDRRQRQTAAVYLAKLIVGWAVGMGLAVIGLSHILNTQIYFLSSVFLGLTAGAIPLMIRDEKPMVKRGLKSWPVFFVGLLAVAGMVVLRGRGTIVTLNFASLSLLQYGYLAITGVAAIAAMLLPGMSGSTLLLIFGVYAPAVTAASSLLTGNLAVLPGVLVLGAGIIIGILFASRLIKRAMVAARPQMMMLILGLLVGSLYAIVMGPTTLSVPQAPMSLSHFHVVGFLFGIVILAGLEWVKHLQENGLEAGGKLRVNGRKEEVDGVS